MKHFFCAVLLLVFFSPEATMAATDMVLLKAIYTQQPGSNVEYAQGAIERYNLAHREIVRNTFLIQVEAPADPGEWEAKLNAFVDQSQGSFHVVPATPEEEEKVRKGEIELQR